MLLDGFSIILNNFPITILVDKKLLNFRILLICFSGVIMVLQGLTGIKYGNICNPNAASKHLSYTKRYFIFFAILFIIKITLDIIIITNIGRCLEQQLNDAPSLVAHHNRYNNKPHIILLYKNGTILFDERPKNSIVYIDLYKFKQDVRDYKDFDNPKRDHEIKKNSHLPKHNKPSKKKFEDSNTSRVNFFHYLYFYPKEDTLLIRIDRLQGHVTWILLEIYIFLIIIYSFGILAGTWYMIKLNIKFKKICEKISQANIINQLQSNSN